MYLLVLVAIALRVLAASCSCQPSSKRGILYTDAEAANPFKAQCAGCSWASNWRSTSDGLVPSLQYIPMLRDTVPENTIPWESNVRQALASGSQALFSFNEPDLQDTTAGSNLTVALAVEQHARYMHQFVGKALIGSPSVTSEIQQGLGLDWLKGFISQCNQSATCHFDFCSVHWYGDANQVEMLFQHLEAAHAACGDKPIWLTELGLLTTRDWEPSDYDKCAFITTVMPRLERLPYLATYALFMGRFPGEPVLPDTGKTFGEAYAVKGGPELC